MSGAGGRLASVWTRDAPSWSKSSPFDVELGQLLAMLFMMIDEKQSIIVHVTSANHGEGTSLVARGIAEAAAAVGWCKVALIQAEARNARGDGSDAQGLLERFELGEGLALRADHDGVAAIAIGRLRTAGACMPPVAVVRGLYEVLRSKYTLVVVDGAPVLSSQDIAVLVSIADSTIMVVEAECTTLAQIQQAKYMLEQFGAALLGVVLNKRRRRVPRFIDGLI